jgi:hypothetical protein
VPERWLNTARSLGGGHGAGEGNGRMPSLDLAGLLGWRLDVLRSHRYLGRAIAERLLQESTRALLEIPPERPAAGASWPLRLRRRVAGRASRVVFGAWRMAQRA